MSRDIRVSPSIAAALFGVSERSIRRAVKNDELKFVVKNSRYQIQLKDLIEWSDALPNRRKKCDEDGIGQFIKEWKISKKEKREAKRKSSNEFCIHCSCIWSNCSVLHSKIYLFPTTECYERNISNI